MINTANELFTKDEIKRITERSNWRSAVAIFNCWLTIFAMLAMVYYLPNIFTIVIALIIIGGRQLCLAITMHEASHRTLFTSSKWNDHIGQWLASWPIFQDVYMYREHHLRHHRHNGTEKDPDLHLASGFPISKKKFWRNTRRDLTGVVGFKALIGSLLMLAGIINYSVSSYAGVADRKNMNTGQKITAAIKGLSGAIFANILIFTLCLAIGSAWLYLLWIGAYLTTYMFYLRLRATAEHGLTYEPNNALTNARTTYANWLARLTIAPLHVNYHLEHHMLVAIPWHKLPLAHTLLKEKGVFERQSAMVVTGYQELSKQFIKN